MSRRRKVVFISLEDFPLVEPEYGHGANANDVDESDTTSSSSVPGVDILEHQPKTRLSAGLDGYPQQVMGLDKRISSSYNSGKTPISRTPLASSTSMYNAPKESRPSFAKGTLAGTGLSLLPDEQREAEMRRILAKRQERKSSEQKERTRISSNFDKVSTPSLPQQRRLTQQRMPGGLRVDESAARRERTPNVDMSTRSVSAPHVRPVVMMVEEDSRRTPMVRRSVDYNPSYRFSTSSSVLKQSSKLYSN